MCVCISERERRDREGRDLLNYVCIFSDVQMTNYVSSRLLYLKVKCLPFSTS